MMRASLRRPSPGVFQNHRRFAIQRSEQAALIATDRASAAAKAGDRQDMAGAGLGRLGFALGSGSDLRKTGHVHRFGASGFRASGWIFVRSRSERTLGTIQIYTEGGEILPRKGWLWMPTDNVPKRVGRYRMTPKRYMSSPLASSIGPLVQIPGRHSGEALLVVRNVTTRSAGHPNPRRLPRSGRARAGREVQDMIVMFVGIRRTSRTQRVDPAARHREQQARLPSYWHQAIGMI